MVRLQVFVPIKKGGLVEQKGAISPLIIVSNESFSMKPPNTHTHVRARSHCYPLFIRSAAGCLSHPEQSTAADQMVLIRVISLLGGLIYLNSGLPGIDCQTPV